MDVSSSITEFLEKLTDSFFQCGLGFQRGKNKSRKKIKTKKGGDAAEQRFRYFQNTTYENSYDYNNINSNNVEQERPRRHSTGNARCYATAMDHPYTNRNNVEQERLRRLSTGNARSYATAMDHPYTNRSHRAHSTAPARRRTNTNNINNAERTPIILRTNTNNINNNLKKSRSIAHCKRDPMNFYSGRVHYFLGF